MALEDHADVPFSDRCIVDSGSKPFGDLRYSIRKQFVCSGQYMLGLGIVPFDTSC